MLSLAGSLCRLLLVNSTLYGASNTATIAFTTPANVAPSSMLMCFNSTRVQLSAANFQVVSLGVFGTLYTGPLAYEQLNSGSAWNTSTFFQQVSGGVGLQAAQFGGLRNVLSTDGFYSGTFFAQRYDNVWRDWEGNLVTGLAPFPPPTPVDVPRQQQAAAGNCVLLTGAWRRGTLYQVAFTLTNPGAPASLQPQPLPLPWVAPITSAASTFTLGNGTQLTDVAFAVRSSKFGALCTMRTPVASALGLLWDACSAYRALVPSGQTAPNNQTECVAALQSMVASNASLAGTWPFSAPPVAANLTVDSFPDGPCAQDDKRTLSPKYGGTCISCGSGVKDSSGRCVCPEGVASALLGGVACPLTNGSSGTDVSLKDTGRRLCEVFNVTQNRWLNYSLSAKTVARTVLKAFRLAAGSVVDQTAIDAANQTFYATLVFDDRRPNSPTRTYGIKPVCSKCDGKPTFPNVFRNRQQAQLFDYQFDAMNTFRLIGYILDTVVGVPCTSLWDKNDPKQWKYGFYQDIMCQKLNLLGSRGLG